MTTHYGVIYDAKTLAPRRVIVPSDTGSQSLFDGTHKALDGEVLCTVLKADVAHIWKQYPGDLGEVAREAIRRHAGKEPPTMAEVHERKL